MSELNRVEFYSYTKLYLFFGINCKLSVIGNNLC